MAMEIIREQKKRIRVLVVLVIVLSLLLLGTNAYWFAAERKAAETDGYALTAPSQTMQLQEQKLPKDNKVTFYKKEKGAA